MNEILYFKTKGMNLLGMFGSFPKYETPFEEEN